DAHDVDAVGVGRIHLHLGVILTLLIAGVAFLPSHAAIVGAVETAASFRTFHLRVNHVGIGWRVVEADAAQVAHGESAAYLGPSLAGVDGAPQCASRTAVDDSEIRALPLVGGRQQDVGIVRIHHDIGATGVVVHFNEALRVRLAAVGGVVEAALTAPHTRRTRSRDLDQGGIARINH